MDSSRKMYSKLKSLLLENCNLYLLVQSEADHFYPSLTLHRTPIRTDFGATIYFEGLIIYFMTILDDLDVSKFGDFKVWVSCIRKA